MSQSCKKIMAVFLTAFLLGFTSQLGSNAYVTDGFATRENEPAQIDFPWALWQKNTGGRDGAGLCVFTSAHHSCGVWADDALSVRFLEFMRTQPGGGYPDKFKAMVTRFIEKENAERRKQNLPAISEPPYIQIESTNKQEFMDLMARALDNGHMPAITYSYSPSGRYNGQQIAHMVNLVAARVGANKLWGFMDNNYRGVEWMDEDTAWRVISKMGGAWAIIFLNPGPPPVPHN